jgi:hypothetical protein
MTIENGFGRHILDYQKIFVATRLAIEKFWMLIGD